MILLTSASDLIQLTTSATAAIAVHADWVDNNSGTITPGRTNTLTSSATTQTIVGSPASSTQRNLKTLSLRNNDASVSNTLTIQHTDGTTVAILFKITLAAGETLVWIEGTGWLYYNASGQVVSSALAFPSVAVSSAAPTGGVSTTEKAMGLGSSFTYTPQKTGNLLVFIAGVALNSTAAGDGTTITGRFGTGTAPVNAATTGLGTQISIPQHFVASTTAGQQGWMIMGKITGQAIGTPLWFDVSLLAVTGGGSTVKDVQIVVVEVP